MDLLEKRIHLLNKLDVPTPSYVIDEEILEHNLKILKDIKDKTGAKILTALKAFTFPRVFPIIAKYLDGACASGAYEAKIGRELGKEVHTFGPAYSEKDIQTIIDNSDTIIFNSFNQLKKFGQRAKAAGKQIGLRVNPGYAEASGDLYNACIPGSRFGVSKEEFEKNNYDLVDGLHFHALDQKGSESLEKVLASFENRFKHIINKFKWVNFGGGHLITSETYNRELLINLITNFKKKYQVEVHLEPGFAVGLNAGYLVTSVLDIVDNGLPIIIIDSTFECHMPDTISAVPYRPEIWNAARPNQKKFTYGFGGPTCLAGDRLGSPNIDEDSPKAGYSFDKEIKVGDRLIFLDMAVYSFVKNNTFNGVPLPTLALLKKDGTLEIVKKFGFEDYRNRLG